VGAAITRWLTAVFLIFALSVGAPARAQTTASAATGTLQGRISDTLGAAISGFVLVHSNQWVKIGEQVSVNENGEFQIQLAPGLYDLFVSYRGFIPWAKKIKIQPGKPTVLKIKLQVDMANLED
jgi:hypothetical protein